jgi:hypothetical protein
VANIRKQIADVRAAKFFTSSSQYDTWTRSIVDVIQKVDAFNVSPPMASSEMYDNLNGITKELAVKMREFREDPHKFLRLKLF